MRQRQPIDPHEFVSTVHPLLEQQNTSALATLLRDRWTSGQIAGLLASERPDARKVAALSLGLVGDRSCVDPLAERLHDHDAVVNEMAEYALWSIWFRCGDVRANRAVAAGVKALNDRDYEDSVKHFDLALKISPDFAEAYNQRGIAHYLLEDYDASIESYRHAIRLMPVHFGAWCGVGHGMTQLGETCEAITAYRKALQINPYLSSVRSLIEELREEGYPADDDDFDRGDDDRRLQCDPH